MAKGRPLSDATKRKIKKMHAAGVSYREIAKRTGLHKNTVVEFIYRERGRRKSFPPHCYACEYRVEEPETLSRHVTPDVIGCMLCSDSPKTCRNWHDDQLTAERVKKQL